MESVEIHDCFDGFLAGSDATSPKPDANRSEAYKRFFRVARTLSACEGIVRA